MALIRAEGQNDAPAHEVSAGGEWRDGVFVPSNGADLRTTRTTLIHDLVRSLLELQPK